MKLNDKAYSYVKWGVSIVLPALAVLVGTLGKAYGWGDTDLAVTTISAVTVFLGGTMLHSTSEYNKEESK